MDPCFGSRERSSSPSSMGMMDVSARSSTSSDSNFGSNGRVSPNPIPPQLSYWLREPQRIDEIRMGIFSTTMMIMAPMMPIPPQGRLSATAIMLGRRWVQKSKTWQVKRSIQRPIIHRSTSSPVKTTAERVEDVGRDIEALNQA